MFAAMRLLEAEEPTGVRPLGLLVESLAVLTEEFRDVARGVGTTVGRRTNGTSFTHSFATRSIDPMKTVALHWVWTFAPEIDGRLLDSRGRCYHFACILDETIEGATTEVTMWDELDPSTARSIYGDLDAGIDLLRRESQASH